MKRYILILNTMLLYADPSDISFTLPVGAEYKTELLDFQHINEQIHITLQVTPEIWEHVDLIMMFNLQWNARHAGTISGTGPVQIKMLLGKEVYKSLKASGTLLSDKEAFLSSDSSHGMCASAAWFAIEVTEEVALPDLLKEKGTLRQGFTTIWKEDFE